MKINIFGIYEESAVFQPIISIFMEIVIIALIYNSKKFYRTMSGNIQLVSTYIMCFSLNSITCILLYIICVVPLIM